MAWTSPRTWVAAETVTASIMNTHVRDNLLALSTWTSYTPTWTATTTNPAIGNGSISGSYISVGKLCLFRIAIAMGSTTTYGSGFYTFSLPVQASGAQAIGGGCRLLDTSASLNQDGDPYIITGAPTLFRIASSSGTLSPTVPWTWANGDELMASGFYEAA